MTASDLDRIHERIDQALAKLEAAVVTMTRIQATCPLHAGRLTKVEASVFGNGQAGLDKRVDRLEQRRAAMALIAGGAVALISAAVGGAASALMERRQPADGTTPAHTGRPASGPVPARGP